MRARPIRTFLVAVAMATACLVGSAPHAVAQPKVCGNQAALGTWNLAGCLTLKDDGISPDVQSGDGIFSAAAQLTATPLLEYKILPTGAWDGSSEIHAIGTCPADGGAKRNDTQNIQVVNPDTRQPTLFFFDGRTLTDPSYAVAPSNRSGGDSAMLDAPAGGCPRWLAVGDFQNLYGANGTAVTLTLLRPGVWVGKTTAAKALATGWRWKILEATPGVAREYGPGGWSYAPCEAAFATVTTQASVGDTIYFLFHAYGGRMQTLVSGAPLDGFSTDGVPACVPPPDAGAPLDLAAPSVDSGTGPAPLDGAVPTTDGGGGHRPGIHCDCQIGRGRAAVSSDSRSLGGTLPILSLLASLFLLLRRRLAPLTGSSETALSRRAPSPSSVKHDRC